MAIHRGKIVIIGAGHVGSAILNSLLGMNLAREIVLVNLDYEQALGEALDAGHTLAFSFSAGCRVRVGDYKDCADAQIIVSTAGPSILPGEKRDRMQLLEQNLSVTASVMDGVTRYTRDAILIQVTNPVDVLTYFCVMKYDYPRTRVFSTGTLLDTARFAKILADILHIDPRSVSGFVLGEDGERGMRACDEYLRSVLHTIDVNTLRVQGNDWLGGFPPQYTNPAAAHRAH